MKQLIIFHQPANKIGMSLMKEQPVVTPTIRQTEIPALPDSSVMTHLLSKSRIRKKLLLLISL